MRDFDVSRLVPLLFGLVLLLLLLVSPIPVVAPPVVLDVPLAPPLVVPVAPPVVAPPVVVPLMLVSVTLPADCRPRSVVLSLLEPERLFALSPPAQAPIDTIASAAAAAVAILEYAPRIQPPRIGVTPPYPCREDRLRSAAEVFLPPPAPARRAAAGRL